MLSESIKIHEKSIFNATQASQKRSKDNSQRQTTNFNGQPIRTYSDKQNFCFLTENVEETFDGHKNTIKIVWSVTSINKSHLLCDAILFIDRTWVSS